MAKKKQPQAQTPELFTVYYMNQDKVFEMRMLLDNRLQTGHTGEQTGSTSSEANINAEAGAKVPFLTELQGNIEGKIGHEKQTKMVDTLEYIHTKSRMLSDIIARCSVFEGNSANEGDLVYIDDVNLELLNEDEVRARRDHDGDVRRLHGSRGRRARYRAHVPVDSKGRGTVQAERRSRTWLRRPHPPENTH